MRRLRPEFWKAMAMQNMANTKKIVGVANSCIILGRGRMPATAGQYGEQYGGDGDGQYLEYPYQYGGEHHGDGPLAVG